MTSIGTRKSMRFSGALVLLALMAACSNTGNDRVMPLTPKAADGGVSLGSKEQQWLRMAESAAQSGDRQTALGLYQQVINNDPGADEAWLGMGNLLLAMGNIRGSADAFAQMLQRSPGDREASVGYARAMMALGRPEAAAAHVEPVLERSPEDLSLLNLLAVIRDLQGDHQSAHALYRRGLLLDPESVMLRNNMALSLALAGQYEASVNLIEPIVDGLQSTRQTRQNYALIQGLAGNYAESERISLIDLDADSTANNIAYYAALRSMEPGQARSAVLRPNMRSVPSFTGRETGSPVILGTAVDGGELALGDTPAETWFVQLGTFGTREKVDEAWHELLTANGKLLNGLRPVATAQEGPQVLTAGPLSGRAEAELICNSIAAGSDECKAIRL